MTAAIVVDTVSKSFRIGAGRNSTLKEKILRGGTAKHKEYVALRDVSLEIGQGTTVGLIGINGSGKSTLLKLISRILYPDAGSITVRGKVSSLLELGAGFHPDFTGRENAYMNAALLGLSRRQVDQRINEIVDFSGLGEFIDQPVKGYSSGMYMRLAFSVATMIDPDVLLIDEVLAVGDAAFQAKCFTRLRELRESGKTIVMVTHDLNAVERFCDRAVWLSHGTIIADGKPRDVTQGYIASTFNTAPEESPGAAPSPVGKESNEEPKNSGRRWGNANVVISDVRLKGQINSGVHLSGNAFIAEIRYEFSADYDGGEPLMFGMNICDSDGRSVYGTNTVIDGFDVGIVTKRKGSILFKCDSLQLLEGLYTFDASVYHVDGTPYDHRLDCVRFTVVNPQPEAGVVRLQHQWIVDNSGT